MAARDSQTLRVLREIRDEVRGTNSRLERLDERVAGLEPRLVGVEGAVVSVERRVMDSELRLATELMAVAGVVGEVRDLLRDNLQVRNRVEEHERRINAIERRLKQ